jgi:hypothetical protein
VTDRPESHDPAETPEVAAVRRLLAESRHSDPMPGDVVARMDAVLARLGAGAAPAEPVPAEPDPAEPDHAEPDPAEPGATTTVTPTRITRLSARRRKTAALLVAAAAVVVGGVAVAPHVHLSSSNSPAGASADSAGSGTESNFGATGNPGRAPSAASKSAVRHGRLVVRPRHFSADALHGRAFLHNMQRAQVDANASCPGAPAGVANVPAEYQHAPAALVYRRPRGSTQVVELFVCGSDRPIRSTTLPAP